MSRYSKPDSDQMLLHLITWKALYAYAAQKSKFLQRKNVSQSSKLTLPWPKQLSSHAPHRSLAEEVEYDKERGNKMFSTLQTF